MYFRDLRYRSYPSRWGNTSKATVQSHKSYQPPNFFSFLTLSLLLIVVRSHLVHTPSFTILRNSAAVISIDEAPSSKATLMASLSFSSFAANVKVLDVAPVEEELDDGGVILEAERIRCFKDLFSASNSHVSSPAFGIPLRRLHVH